jgi:FkbM family methyltransferase
MSLTKLKKAFLREAMTKAEFIEEMHKRHQHLYEYAEFIRNTDIARIEIAEGRVVMTTREGVQISCDPRDKRIAPVEILNFGSYEGAHASMLNALAEDGFTILDIGANVGYYTIRLAKQFPQASIFAFEPVPKTFENLQGNIELNGITNATAFNFGLSDRNEERVFYCARENSVSASAARLNLENNRRVVCRVERLDDFRKTHPLTVDFLKCDVEGAEYFVFQGAAETLRQDKPIIVTEMLRKWSAKFHYHPNDIIGFLGEMGYRCFTAQDRRLHPFARMDEGTVQTNFFFLHPEKHGAKIAQWLIRKCA